MSDRKQAVVVGALGMSGRYITERLLKEEDWSVVGLSRRATDSGPGYRHVSVDLLDARDVEEKLADLRDTTQIFYAAFQAPTAPRRAMRPTSRPIATCSSTR